VNEEDVQSTVSALQDITLACRSVPEKEDHPLFDILRMFEGRLPMVYGTGMLRPAARRLAAQMNENAKLPAHYGELPEMNHNEVVGLIDGSPWAKRTVLLILADPDSPGDVLRRVEVTRDIARDAGFEAEIFLQEGGTPLMRLLATVVIGDWISYWSAVGRGVDPTPIEPIDRLKAAL
jgi:glucose/mannose-6-phosphate isomerase